VSVTRGEPNGCLNDAPCPPCTSHGASIRHPFDSGVRSACAHRAKLSREAPIRHRAAISAGRVSGWGRAAAAASYCSTSSRQPKQLSAGSHADGCEHEQSVEQLCESPTGAPPRRTDAAGGGAGMLTHAGAEGSGSACVLLQSAQPHHFTEYSVAPSSLTRLSSTAWTTHSSSSLATSLSVTNSPPPPPPAAPSPPSCSCCSAPAAAVLLVCSRHGPTPTCLPQLQLRAGAPSVWASSSSAAAGRLAHQGAYMHAESGGRPTQCRASRQGPGAAARAPIERARGRVVSVGAHRHTWPQL
jgi:hypothetical protein